MTAQRPQEPTGTGLRLFALLITVTLFSIQGVGGIWAKTLSNQLEAVACDVRLNNEHRHKAVDTREAVRPVWESLQKILYACTDIDRRVTLNEERIGKMPPKSMVDDLAELKADVKLMRAKMQDNHDALIEIKASLKKLNGNSP